MGEAETAFQNLQEGFSQLALMVQTLQAKIPEEDPRPYNLHLEDPRDPENKT